MEVVEFIEFPSQGSINILVVCCIDLCIEEVGIMVFEKGSSLFVLELLEWKELVSFQTGGNTSG